MFFNLPRGRSGGLKGVAITVSITGTGAINTGLRRLLAPAIVSVQNAPTTITSVSVEVTGITGGTVNVVVVDHTITAGAEHAISTTAYTIGVIAIGD